MAEHGHHGHGGQMTPEQQKQMIAQELNFLLTSSTARINGSVTIDTGGA